MANKYYSIGLTTPMADIKAALQDKYGSGNVTVYYETTAYLIVGCTAISDKVIKFNWYNSSALLLFYGDAWTSGSTITNQVQFAGYSGGTTSEIHLVLGSNMFFLNLLSSYINSMTAVIAKMSNNDYICIGLVGVNGSSYYATFKGRNTTDAVDVKPDSFAVKFASNTGKLYKQDVRIIKTDGTLEANGDGSFATIPDLYNISHSLSQALLIKASNYIMSPTTLYMADGNYYIRTSLFAEF